MLLLEISDVHKLKLDVFVKTIEFHITEHEDIRLDELDKETCIGFAIKAGLSSSR